MEASSPPAVFHVDEADFERLVIERSHELPVVVDFWAEWCAPCRQLGPVLERAVTERAGEVELAKVDTDANQGLAVRYGIQGIPAVKAFRDGEVADQFTGVLPSAQVERFLDTLIPSEADEATRAAIESGDEQALRRALTHDAREVSAAAALARLLLARGEAQEALATVRPVEAVDYVCGGLAARARLTLAGDAPDQAFAALDEDDHARGLGHLQSAVSATDDAERRDLLRKVMVGLFTELGADSELSREHRRRLATTLS